MITSSIIPRPLARLPWRLIFLVTGIATFGLIVLYSAAGGSVRPWAIKQGVVFQQHPGFDLLELERKGRARALEHQPEGLTGLAAL